MFRALSRITALSLTTAAAVLAPTLAMPAQALPQTTGSADAVSAPVTSASASVATITDRLAHELALSMSGRCPEWPCIAPSTLQDRVVNDGVHGPLDLAAIGGNPALAQSVRQANAAVRVAKGLPSTSVSLLRLRLGHPSMRAALLRGDVPLVAAAPTDDTVTSVTAYDQHGAKVLLDPARVPARPVLVVEVDTGKALGVGLQVIRETLAGRGITGVMSTPTATAAGGYWATKVTAIRLNDDKEPWIKGGAEIFNLVGGFGLDGKAKIDTVTMPYLDNDKTTYFPNQLIVHFSAYKYNLADVVMMEDDGDTNYLQLAQAIATALLYIVDGGAYTPLVNAILAAMPGSWWTDDPDYVDSWYTLATSSSGRLNGAAANGWMDVTPYWVGEL